MNFPVTDDSLFKKNKFWHALWIHNMYYIYDIRVLSHFLGSSTAYIVCLLCGLCACIAIFTFSRKVEFLFPEFEDLCNNGNKRRPRKADLLKRAPAANVNSHLMPLPANQRRREVYHIKVPRSDHKSQKCWIFSSYFSTCGSSQVWGEPI